MDLDNQRILRLPEVMKLSGLSRSQVYELMGDGHFPKNLRLSKRATGWRASDLAAWLESRPPADSA